MPSEIKKSLRSYKPEHFAKSIPRALREQVWIQNNGKQFECKCNIRWCSNTINCFNYHIGHDIPRSKGGTLEIKNLKPICDRCNLSMGNRYTISQWEKMAKSS